MAQKICKSLNIFKSSSVKETLKIAEALAARLKGGEIIFLTGPIGAGKTIFVKGLAKGLGVKLSPVSASFGLMRVYEGKRKTLVHADLFRLSANEISNIGLEEYFANPKAVIAVEWPSECADFFPKERIEADIKLLSGDGREIKINYE